MRRLILWFSLAVGVLLTGLAGLGGWAYYQFNAPGPAATDQVLVLPKGAGLNAIADRLHSVGLLRHRWVFVAGAQLTGDAGSLKAGEYHFPAAISAHGILDLLVSGRTVVRRLTIPEGLTVAQVIELVQAGEGLSGEISSHPQEGSLLPETYHYSYGDDRGDLLARMRSAMDETLAALWPARETGLPLKSATDAVILASIVERETGVADERALVASVFMNRLRRGMRLQSDPTVIYGITQGRTAFDRLLTRADLETETDWNTYRIAGLPPTPIGNPGRAALEAVTQPAESKFLYFVADGSGGHAFAETLAEHNRNVRRWRQLRVRPTAPAQ